MFGGTLISVKISCVQLCKGIFNEVDRLAQTVSAITNLPRLIRLSRR